MKRRNLPGRKKGSSHGLGFWWTFAVALVVFGALIVAILQNSHRVRLHFLAWHISVSLIVVVLTTALIAVFLDEVGGLIWRRRRRSRLGRRSELEHLRTQHGPEEGLPLAEPASPEMPSQEIPISTQRGTR